MQSNAMFVAALVGQKLWEERKDKKVTPDTAEPSRIGNVFTQLISCLLYTHSTQWSPVVSSSQSVRHVIPNIDKYKYEW